MEKNNIKHTLHLHFIVFIWGFTAILGELISIKAIPLVWYRMFLAFIIMLSYFLIKKESFYVPLKSKVRFLIVGTLLAAHWILFFEAIKVSTISIALVMMSSGSLFGSILEPLFFRRKFRLIEFILGLIMILGICIIFNVERGYSLGIIYALISSFLATLFTVINGLYVKKYKASVITIYQMLFGTLVITLYVLVFNQGSLEEFTLVENDWFYLLLLGSICTAYAFLASIKLLKHLTPYTIILTTNLEPVYGILVALLLFKEKELMSTQFYIGASIIFFTVVLHGILKNRILKK